MTPIQALERVRELIDAIGPSEKRSPLAEEILAAAEKGLAAPQTEATTLTLAQQHADELVVGLELARQRINELGYAEARAEIDQLLAKVRPPPPTLEEALDLLRSVRDRFSVGDNVADIDRLLARIPDKTK